MREKNRLQFSEQYLIGITIRCYRTFQEIFLFTQNEKCNLPAFVSHDRFVPR